MHAQHDTDLRRVVHRRGSPNPVAVEDACAHAWTQLLTAEHIDLRPPRWQALAWLTTCPIHRARQINDVELGEGAS